MRDLPWAVDSSSAGQVMPCYLWNTKVHCRVQKSPPLYPVSIKLNPVRAIFLNFITAPQQRLWLRTSTTRLGFRLKFKMVKGLRFFDVLWNCQRCISCIRKNKRKLLCNITWCAEWFLFLLQIVCFTVQAKATPVVKIVLLLRPSQLRIITSLSRISPGLYTSPTSTCVCVDVG
jgi:hypothetical protein